MPRYIDVDDLWRDITSNIEDCGDVLEIIERQLIVTINDTSDEIKVTNCNHIAEDSKKVSISCGHGNDLIKRQDAINALLDELMEKPEHYEDGIDRHDIEAVLGSLPSAQLEVAIKDCRNCKYGNYNDHLETHFCYNPNECTEWNLWEPIAQPEPEEFEWCTDCKEYDQTAHCCHRWTKVIRQTVAEIKAEQPERKRGRWLFYPECDGKSAYYCSQCGRRSDVDYYDYCMWCGAIMLKDGDEE